jgi:hypothetical protein
MIESDSDGALSNQADLTFAIREGLARGLFLVP